jgi:short-subunit dehydrogenase
MSSIQGKHILITGAAMGLGKLMAHAFHKEGAAKLILWDINAQELEHTSKELIDKGASVFHHVVNVADTEQLQQAANKVKGEVGTVHMLINNAGIVSGKAYFWENSGQDIDRTLDINVRAVMHMTRLFLPGMIEHGEGHVVNIASAAGYIANPRMAVYASSKWAVLGWSESLRLELEAQHPNVHVLTMCPSYIDTGMFSGVGQPLLTPLLKPDAVVNRIVKAVKRNEILVRMPFMVNSIPLLKGLLPIRGFDFVAKLFGVYGTMDTFKGRD